MAAAMICDRCKNFFKIEKVKKGLNVTDFLTVGVRTESGNTYDRKFLDICPECREELNAWINEKKLPGDYMDEMKEAENDR